MVSIPLKNKSNGKFSLGECIASDSSPKPIKTGLTSSTFSKTGTTPILPPLRTGKGLIPNVRV